MIGMPKSATAREEITASPKGNTVAGSSCLVSPSTKIFPCRTLRLSSHVGTPANCTITIDYHTAEPTSSLHGAYEGLSPLFWFKTACLWYIVRQSGKEGKTKHGNKVSEWQAAAGLWRINNRGVRGVTSTVILLTANQPRLAELQRPWPVSAHDTH